jgi:hypothetical protein
MERRAPVVETDVTPTEPETNVTPVEPAVNLTPYQVMAEAVGKFVENIQEAENSPNVVEICAAATLFVEALIEPEPEVEVEVKA